MKTRAIHVVQLELAVHVSWWKSESEVAQLCPTLWDRMDCSLPGSSVHGIFKTRILKWVAISFSRRSSLPRDWTQVSHIVGRHFTVWATRELPSWWDYTLSQSSAILRYSPPWKKAQWTQWIFMLLAAMLLLLTDFLVAETLKRLPTLRKTRVQSLGREDLLEKEIATHSHLLA